MLEPLKEELTQRNIHDPFTYGAWAERNYELNVEQNGYKRKTTFTSDFSIAEWFVPKEGIEAISDTLKNALLSWKDDYEYFTELVEVLRMKSFEHYARHNYGYSAMYGDLYYLTRDLYYDWFANNDKAKDYFLNIDD